MEIAILGPMEANGASGPIRLGGTKQRAVLAMLALQLNHVVSVDFLIDGLWSDEPPSSAANVVQSYVSRLRKALDTAGAGGTGEIMRRPPGYLLVLDPDRVDLHRFEELARHGIAALPAAPGRAAVTLREALLLWRGAPLAEFVNEPFARTEISRLQEQRLTALTARVDADLALGRHAELVAELETLVAAHPLHEGLHGQLMLSLYRSGRQAEALQSYHRARTAFVDELGIDPGKRLRDLETAILNHEPGLDWTPPPPSQPSSRLPLPPDSIEAIIDTRISPPLASVSGGAAPEITQPMRAERAWNVPARNPHFTGRADVLTDLHDRLGATRNTLAVHAMYGLGGVGKTQLAIEYAHSYSADYPVAWWIDAEQPALIQGQLAALSGRLGLPTSDVATGTVDRLMDELRDRTGWLLIFDNAEHPRDIAGYRPAGAGHILVTSRSPAWGALGGRTEVTVLTRAETVSLLQARTPEMTDRIAHDLAAELGDLPLAAAQAAAYLEQTGTDPVDYLRRFRARRAALLARGEVLGYQGRVDTAWDVSLQRLQADSPATVELLELAAFLAPDPIPLSLITDHPELLDEPLRSAAADPDELADIVSAATSFSLIRRNGDTFQLHRLVQTVIRQQLPADRRETVLTRVVELLAAAHPDDPNDPENRAIYARLAPHFFAAGSMGDSHADSRQLLIATVAYVLADDAGAGRRIAEDLHHRWYEQLGPDDANTVTAAAVSVTAAVARLANDHDDTPERGLHLLGQARRVLGADHPVTLRLASALTFTLAWLGRLEQACDLGEDSLRRSRQVFGPNSRDALRLAEHLVFALSWQGRTAEAQTLGTQTLRQSNETFGPEHIVTLITAAHAATASMGELDGEPAQLEDLLHRCQDNIGPRRPTTLVVAAHLTLVMIGLGQCERACALGEDTLQRATAGLGPSNIVTMIAAAVLALALAADRQSERARTLGRRTLEQADGSLGPDHLITLTAATALASALSALGDLEAADALGRETLERSSAALGPEHSLTRALATMTGPRSARAAHWFLRAAADAIELP